MGLDEMALNHFQLCSTPVLFSCFLHLYFFKFPTPSFLFPVQQYLSCTLMLIARQLSKCLLIRYFLTGETKNLLLCLCPVTQNCLQDLNCYNIAWQSICMPPLQVAADLPSSQNNIVSYCITNYLIKMTMSEGYCCFSLH